MGTERVYTVPSIPSASPLSLDVLVAVAKLIPQLGLVQLDIILQLGKVLLLLCAKRGLLVLSARRPGTQENLELLLNYWRKRKPN